MRPAPGPFAAPALVVALVLAASLAGCLQPAATPSATPSPDASRVEALADRPGTSFAEVVAGPAVGPDLDATSATAPRLVPGEWWRIRFASRSFEGAPEFLRVVAAVEPGAGYVVGMPHEEWHKEAIAYHAPAFGDVGLDLSYALHNERFEPLRHPVVR